MDKKRTWRCYPSDFKEYLRQQWMPRERHKDPTDGISDTTGFLRMASSEQEQLLEGDDNVVGYGGEMSVPSPSAVSALETKCCAMADWLFFSFLHCFLQPLLLLLPSLAKHFSLTYSLIF
jgi:hypothetical protein